MARFALDPAFLATSRALGALPLCEARLQDDARWPWLVLIPRAPGAREVDDLSRGDQAQLWAEVTLAGRAARAIGAALGRDVETLNIAKIGNVTPQLHLHVVGRRPADALWPAPPWGQPGAEAYAPEELHAALAAARSALARV